LVLQSVKTYKGVGPILSPQQVDKVAQSLAAVNSTAELMGRARVREMSERALSSGGLSKFADDYPLSMFADPPAASVIDTPEAALSYFQSLVPSIGVDPVRFITEQRRKAFTLAASTNKVLTEKIQEQIASGLRENKSVADAVADIRKHLDVDNVAGKYRTSGYAHLIYRTNAQDAFQTGQYEEGRHQDVEGIFPAWKYLIVDDSRTGDDHRPKGGRYYPAEIPFAIVRGKRPYNCILPSQYVSGRVHSASKSFYAGEAIKIHTRGGNSLSLTVNHPVLTTRGFVAAKEIREGDDVVSYFRECQIDVLDVDKQNAPSLIEDVFQTLAVLVGRSRIAPSSLLDFHGDGEFLKGNIHVVGADVELLNRPLASEPERFGEFGISPANVKLAKIPSFRPFASNVERVNLSTSRGLSAGDLNGTLVASHKRPLHLLRLGLASELDATRGYATSDGAAVDSETARELQNRFPRKVRADCVVKIERFDFTGHVLDLGTENGYYVAAEFSIGNGIVISNCRCSMQWVDFIDWQELQGKGARLERSW